MVTMRYTPEQWRAITTTDRHLLVSAGAGTGKTHTVVAKLLWLLGVPVEGKRNPAPLRLRDLAAITYTNQAAADLETKLREALRAANRRDLASEVSAARVGTIHAFCGEVLREFALRGGAPAAARVLEEGESAALLADCARETLLEALEVGQIAGLERLLGDYPAAKVEQWIARLAGDADRLARITAGYARMDDARARALVRLADDARQRLAERLDDLGGVDFDRMIVAVRDLVRDDEGVRRALRRRVRVLVIDEFQDVDPVQHEIAYLLGGVAEAAADATRLVLVGDPKQSIYRFRRADVSIWNRVERDFGEHGLGEVVVLDDNFRSAAPILAFVEHCVGPALGDPVDGERGRQDFEVDFAPVRMSRTSEVPAWAAVELLVVPPTDEGKGRRLDEARAMEAESVARRMRELHDTHRVRWGDMAVLLGGWGALDVYAGALRRHDIPTYALRGEGYWEAREIVDGQLALRVARDPRDDQALLGFLRSPFVGVRDDTLLAIARRCAQPYWDHLSACPLPSETERSRLERGIALAARLAALRDRIPAARLLEELFADSGWLAHLALQGDDGLQPLANVRRLLDDLRRRPEASVGELLREIAESRARGDRMEPARLYGESDDVVTITSVHSAKGLEWRAVFWCDLMRAPRGDVERLFVGRDALVLGDPDLEAKEQPPEWCAARRALELEAAAEQRRLWYVAATRARDLLVLSGIAPGTGARMAGSPAEMLCGRYPALKDGVAGEIAFTGLGAEFRAVVKLAAGVSVVSEDQAPRPVAMLESLVMPPAPVAVPAGRGRHSATELMLRERCAKRHWLRYVVGLREPEPELAPDGGDGDGPHHATPIARGQIVHDVLERLHEAADVERLVEDAVERWDASAPSVDSPAGAAYREALAAAVREVAQSPEYAELATRMGARRELGFLHVLDETTAMQGAIDLAAPDGEGVVLLDVKTSELHGGTTADAVAARYELQQRTYARAVEAIAGLPVRRFAFQVGADHVTAGALPDTHPSDHGPRDMPAMPLARDAAECARCGYRTAGVCAGVVA